jgi:hypothetical protein
MVQIAWIALLLLPALIILGEWIFGSGGDDSSVDTETRTKAGIVLVRIAWAAAILVPVLIIAGALLSGGDGGGSSRQSPEVASTPPAAPHAGAKAQRTKNRARPSDHGQPVERQVKGGRHPSSGSPPPSTGEPGGGGGSTPVVNPEPKPVPVPQPKPTPAPPETPAQSQPPVTEAPTAPVQTTPVTVANNNDGP